MITTHDLNLFAVGQTVSVKDVADYQNITIERVSDCGVTVSGPKCPPHSVISGGSPAYLVDTVAAGPSKTNFATILKSEGDDGKQKERAARGSYASIMESIKIPDGDNFTVKQLADLNGIPVPYAANWMKINCMEVGKAEKTEGQRGRASSLWAVKIK